MLEVTAIAKKLGLPETAFEDETKFDAAFNDPKTGYIPRAKALEDDGIAKHFNDQTGKRIGQLEAATRKVFKEDLGIEDLDSSGLLEDVFADGANKIKAKLSKLAEDAKKGNDTKLTELTNELGTFKAKYESEKERADATNKLLEATKGEFENYKTTLKSNQLFQSELSKIELIPDMTDLQKKGFHALIAESYEFKLDKDGETLEVYKKGEAKRAKNEAGNQNMTVEEALKELADKNGLLKKNNMNREQYRKQEAPPEQNGRPERIPRDGRHLSRLKN